MHKSFSVYNYWEVGIVKDGFMASGWPGRGDIRAIRVTSGRDPPAAQSISPLHAKTRLGTSQIIRGRRKYF